MRAVIAVNSKKDNFRIVSNMSGRGIPKNVLLEFINDVASEINIPVVSVDKNGHFLFEYLVFTPCSVEGAMANLNWFDSSFNKFLEAFTATIDKAIKNSSN